MVYMESCDETQRRHLNRSENEPLQLRNAALHAV